MYVYKKFWELVGGCGCGGVGVVIVVMVVVSGGGCLQA